MRRAAGWSLLAALLSAPAAAQPLDEAAYGARIDGVVAVVDGNALTEGAVALEAALLQRLGREKGRWFVGRPLDSLLGRYLAAGVGGGLLTTEAEVQQCYGQLLDHRDEQVGEFLAYWGLTRPDLLVWCGELVRLQSLIELRLGLAGDIEVADLRDAWRDDVGGFAELPFEEARGPLEALLQRQRRSRAYRDWLEELKGSRRVEIRR